MESLTLFIGIVYLGYFKTIEKLSKFTSESETYKYFFQRIPAYTD